jgi:hypothetical protein
MRHVVYPESTVRASPGLGLPTTLYSSQHDSSERLACEIKAVETKEGPDKRRH